MQDILDDEKPAIEYLDGRAHRKVSPRFAHGLVAGNLCAILRRCAGERGAIAPELHVYPGRVDKTETIFVPDVSFVSWENLEALSEDERGEPRAPDIAVEVRSPSNDLRYLEQKIARYLAAGSLLVLGVDPKLRRIFAHDRDGLEAFKSGQPFARASVPWLTFDVAEAFANLDRLPVGREAY
jgi:Uma2 family endonuclease